MLNLNKNTLSTDTEINLVMGQQSSPITYADALENYKKNTDWWVVLAAFSLSDYQPSSLWISQKVKLPVDIVVEALEGLSVLGQLKKDNGSYYSIQNKTLIKSDFVGLQKADVIEEHFLISQQIISQLEEDALMACDHRCFASNIDILNELFADITKALEKACAASLKAQNKDRIFKTTFTSVDLLNRKNNHETSIESL